MSVTKSELLESINDLELNIKNPNTPKEVIGKLENLLVQDKKQLADLEAAESKVAETKAAEVKAAEAKPSEAKVEKVKQVSEKKQEAKKEFKKEVKQTKEVVKKAKAVLDKVKAKMKKVAPTPPPAKPVKIVEKAKAKVAKARVEKAEPTTKPSKSEKVEAAIKLAIKLRRKQDITWKRDAVERDAKRASKGISRISSVTGKEYKEYRENRMDRKPNRYPRLERGGGVSNDVDTLELYFHDKANFNKAKIHFEVDSIFTPEEVNEEFKCFSFKVEDMDDADSTEFGIEQELQETDLSGYHFEIENEEYADGGTLGAGSFAEGGDIIKSGVKYPTNLKVGSIIIGVGFSMLKGIDNDKFYKIVEMDNYSATFVLTDSKGLRTGSKKIRHLLSNIEGAIKTVSRGDNNGISVVKYDDGGTIGAGSFAFGGDVDNYKIRLEFWSANVYEDDYNEGQGKEVNYFDKKENQTFDSVDDLVRYISSNILYTDVSKEDFALIGEGQIGTAIMVDADNSPADKTEIELWKKGEFKLYTADYNFTIKFVIEKEPTEEELIKLFGRDTMANGGQMSLFKKGGKVKKQLLEEEEPFLSNYKYIPKGLIQEIEVERRGKTTFIDGADVLDGNYVRKEIKFEHGGGLDKNGVKYALAEFVSSGTIANFTDMVNYKDIDAIRFKAIEILDREGDAPYSLSALKSVLLQAKDEYLESKSEDSYGKGGFFGASSRYNEGTAWQNDHYRHNKEEKYEVPMSERKFIRKNGETHRRND